MKRAPCIPIHCVLPEIAGVTAGTVRVIPGTNRNDVTGSSCGCGGRYYGAPEKSGNNSCAASHIPYHGFPLCEKQGCCADVGDSITVLLRKIDNIRAVPRMARRGFPL